MQSNRLQNKVAVVTGCGSGIGQGCALMLARHVETVMQKLMLMRLGQPEDIGWCATSPQMNPVG